MLGILLGIITIILSCGIKGDPKPVIKPEYSLKILGNFVVIEIRKGKLEGKNFLKKGNFYTKKVKNTECFNIIGEGTRERICVKGEPLRKVEVDTYRETDSIVVHLPQDLEYEAYIYRGDLILPPPVASGKGSRVSLPVKGRSYQVRIFLLKEGKAFAYVDVYVPPERVFVPPPSQVTLLKKGKRIYILWVHPWENVRFKVFKNSSLVTPEPSRSRVFSDRIPKEETLYEIVAVDDLGNESPPARVVYKP